jgi:hypothetical protein
VPELRVPEHPHFIPHDSHRLTGDNVKKIIVPAIIGLAVAGLTACSSGPPQSDIGPFTISACKMGWTDPQNDTVFLPTAATAQTEINNFDGPNSGDVPYPASQFSITLTATAVVQSFTVAYYDSSGREIATGSASNVSGPDELTAGQKATFEDNTTFIDGAEGATSCQVIGSDTGNE